jgi:hypothetical protein
MSLDNSPASPAAEPSNALDMNGAAQAFGAFLDPPKVEEKSAEDLESEALADLTATPEKVESEAEAAAEEDEGVTIEVDGKAVKLTKAELAEAYKGQLRQSDYTKKTMEVAEARKVADAETAKARDERNQYAQALQRNAVQLEGAISEQNKIDWQALLSSDPVEYLKQQHLLQQRQAAYQQTIQQQDHVAQQAKAEHDKARGEFLREQQDQLLAKLPDWKDPAKASAEKEALGKYLIAQGFDKESISNISDHKAVILGRKAMLYDAMMAKAKAASKKVEALPQKVVKPGVGDSPSNLDKRSQQYQRLARTGRVEDAAALFGNFL